MAIKTNIKTLLGSRLKDKNQIKRASRAIDKIRKKHGKPEKGFNTVEALRKLRDSR